MSIYLILIKALIRQIQTCMYYYPKIFSYFVNLRTCMVKGQKTSKTSYCALAGLAHGENKGEV